MSHNEIAYESNLWAERLRLHTPQELMTYLVDQLVYNLADIPSLVATVKEPEDPANYVLKSN